MAELKLFRAELIFPHTWQISYTFPKEGSGASHVYCYLIEGETYAAVIDTMYGYGNLRAFCESLTDKPLKLINTHFHIDHVAGNFHFDEVCMHWRDIPDFNNTVRQNTDAERIYASALSCCREDMRPLLKREDIQPMRPMFIEPLEDGDVFDLGGRTLEVIYAGGHTKGSIALLDRKNRCLFTGDCCNSNTLLGLWKDTVLSVQEYLENLLHLETFRDAFDITYAGHQVLPARVIEDGIELCAKVLAGHDDAVTYHVLNMDMTYAASREHGMTPQGNLFNMSYHPDKVHKPSDLRKIIR